MMVFKINHEKQNKLIHFSYKGNTLLLKMSDTTTRELNFDFPIKQVFEFENKILIRIEPGIGAILNENVYCYSTSGFFLWQVHPNATIDADCPYTNISVDGEKI